MRNVLFVLSFIFCLCSCSVGIENEASKQMEKTLKSLAKDPNAQISDTKVVFKTDSMIVLHCVLRGVNGLGGYTRSEMEYIYGIFSDGKRQEALQDLKDNKSIVKSSNENYRKIKADNPDDNSLDSIKNIEMNIIFRLAMFGREIER